MVFPRKLYDMVDDPETDECIYWASDGKSFFVFDPERFSREVLPRYFKHSKFSSFVRQLNMYGFHKIPQLKNEMETELCQFVNPTFQRGEPDRQSIKRKDSTRAGASGEAGEEEGAISRVVGSSGSSGSSECPAVVDVGPVALQPITAELAAIKRHQTTILSDLKELEESSQRLWHESFKSRDRQQQLQDTINKILSFLAGVFGTSANAAGNATQTAGVPIIGGSAVMPRKKARLMIDDGKGKKREAAVNSSKMDEIAEISLPGMSKDSDMFFIDGMHLSRAAYSPRDATFSPSQTEFDQTRPPPASDGMDSTLPTHTLLTNTNANPPELPREMREPTQAAALPATTFSDLGPLASTSSSMPSPSYPFALHSSNFMTSAAPLIPTNAGSTSLAPPHEPSSSTALTSGSTLCSLAPGSMDDPALQAALLNTLLSSVSYPQHILDVFTPQVTTQLAPLDPAPRPPILQQLQPPPVDNTAPRFFQGANPAFYPPDAQNEIASPPQTPLDSSFGLLGSMYGAFDAGVQLDPDFTNMDITAHINSLAQSNAQLQRTFQAAADIDNRINTLQSYLGGYVPSSSIPEASKPSELDASNDFPNWFGADELDTHLGAWQLGDAFDLGLEIVDESSSTPIASHFGAYVDEVGSASVTSSQEIGSERVVGCNNSGKKRKSDANGATHDEKE